MAVLGTAFLIAATVIVAYTALIPAERIALGVGQVAPGDVLAPISLTYESEVLTRLARQSAADSVGRVYDPPNPGVLRQQIQLARNALDFINNVRFDTYATREQQLDDLSHLTSLELAPETFATMLDLPDDAWKDVDTQVMQTLERAMRNVIREDQLQSAYATLPNLVSITVSETQANLIVALVGQLIRPNSFYNEERTREARAAKSVSVPPVTRSFAQGQIVVRAGTVVTEADLEALTQLRLLQPSDQRLRIVAGAALAVVLVSLLTFLFIRRTSPVLLADPGRMVLIGVLFLLFLSGGRLYDVQDAFLGHLYPAAAFTLIVVGIAGASAAVALTGALAALTGVMIGQSLEYSALIGLGGLAGVLALRRTERLNAYFTAGLVIGVANVAVGLIFALTQRGSEPFRALTTVPAGLLNGGMAAGVGLVGLYLASHLLNLPTSIKLLELSQPGQPLLQRLLREAPGTYQHSLQVANLAELAAERIGANAPLLRVAALYHDIGKLSAPLFFGENQVEGVNPHEQLPPQESARIIISHVTEGEKLARKHRLPAIFIDFILQHHGTTRALYFYNKVLEAVGGDETKVDPAPYTYPGPRPQTREAAIMMLADTSESVIRSRRSRDKQEIADTVSEIIRLRLSSGQLDESGLTVNDLRVIQEVFVSSLQGIFHPRIPYPAAPRLTQEMPAVPTAAGDARP